MNKVECLERFNLEKALNVYMISSIKTLLYFFLENMIYLIPR